MSDAELLLLAETRKKSGIIAALLNLFIPGAGYMYCGRAGLGILVFFFTVIVSIITFGFLYGIIVFILLIDGFLCAKRYNNRAIRELLATRATAAPAPAPAPLQPTAEFSNPAPVYPAAYPAWAQKEVNATPIIVAVSLIFVTAMIYFGIQKYEDMAKPVPSWAQSSTLSPEPETTQPEPAVSQNPAPVAHHRAKPIKVAAVEIPVEAPPAEEAPVAPPPIVDDLTPVRAVDAGAADHIAAYCASATARATSRAAEILATCRRNELNAWHRLVQNNEFRTPIPSNCSQPPFPDSYTAKEACGSYELHRPVYMGAR